MKESQKSPAIEMEQLEQERLLRKSSFVAKLVALRYRLWLLALREISLRRVLIDNFDKIPPRTYTKVLISLYVKHSFLKDLLFKIESRLRRRIF